MFCKAVLQRMALPVISGDTMMHQAWGPVWHTQHREQGRRPDGRRGLAQEATWGKRPREGGGYGPGACGVVAHAPGGLGACKDRRKRANAAKRLGLETGPLRGRVHTVRMDGKAADQELCAEFQRQRGMTLLTTPRRHRDHTVERQQMRKILNRPMNRTRRRQRGQTVEPRPGVVKDIVARERYWRRGHRHHRWLFAAMGVAVPRHQARALNAHRSPWRIKQEV